MSVDGLPDFPVPLERGVRSVCLTLAGIRPLPVLVMLMPGRASYTAEDTAEVVLPGNPLLLERIESLLLEAGGHAGLPVRSARAGEFTARAFLGGRLTGEQTDSVLLRIGARSAEELRAADSGRQQDLMRDAAGWSEVIAGLLALVEAGIDFTDEEDVVAISAGTLATRVREVEQAMAERLGADAAHERREVVPRVALSGPPNAGKSTLFNALIGRIRSVASPVRGATRDVIEELSAVPHAGGLLRVIMVDTAGEMSVCETGPDADAMALRAAMLGDADLVVLCVPSDDEGPELAGIGGRVLRVRTKCDLGAGPVPPGEICVSAVTGEGLDVLRARIAEQLASASGPVSGVQDAVRIRQEAHLRAAIIWLDGVQQLVLQDAAHAAPAHAELVAQSLRSALDRLGAVSGEQTPDDVLGRIFSSFCVGK